MSKPEDVTQEAWEAADAVWYLGLNMANDRFGGIEMIARAIMAAEKRGYDQWVENVEPMLAGDPDTIRCREGGGPEDMIMSLVLTVARTRNSRDRARRKIAVALYGVDRPEQSIDGLVDALIALAQAAVSRGGAHA